MVDVSTSRTLVIACGALARELLAIVNLNGLDGVTVECLPASLHNRPKEIPDAVRARIHRARRPDAISPGENAPSGVAKSPGQSAPSGDAKSPGQNATGDDAISPGENATGGVAMSPGENATGGDAVDGESMIGEPAGRYDSIFVAYADCGTGGLLAKVCDEEGVEMLSGAHCYQFFATAPRFAEIQDAEIGSFYLTDFLARHFERMIWTGLGLDRHPELLPMYFGNYTRLVYLAQTDDPELLALAEAGAERLGLSMIVEHTGYGELETTMVELTTG